MTAVPQPPPRKRRLFRLAVLGLALLAIGIATGLYLNSAAFENTVRKKLITELERVTGARVEIRAFHWKLARLEVEANDITLHGLEDASDRPYAHIDRLYARAKILSFFGRQIGLRDLRIEHPVVHLLVFPDGSTSQPVPKVKIESNRSSLDLLFDLAIDRAELSGGELWFNDRRLPFDFSGNGVSAAMGYSLLTHRYDGTIRVEQMDAHYGTFQPLRSRAEVDFSLARDGVELKGLHWSSAKSKLDASGRMTNYLDPKIDASYEVALDLGELGAISRRPQLRAGKLLANGQGSYTVAEFSTAGRLRLENAVWAQPGMDVPGATAAADYSATRERISISNLHGTLFRGKVAGEADVQHWSAAAEKTGTKTRRGPAGEAQRGSATFELSGLSVAELAAALSTARVPFNRIQPAGSLGGTVNVRWTGTFHNAEMAFSLDVAPPAAPAPGQVPIDAHVRAAYLGPARLIQVAEFTLATRTTRLSALGTLGSDTARLNVSLNTGDVNEIRPLLVAFHPQRLPVEFHGRAAFLGRVSGKLAALGAAGHLELADFDTTFEVPVPAAVAPGSFPGAAPAPGATRMHWDLMTADVEYSPSLAAVHHGVLTRGRARVLLDLSAQLHQGIFDEHAPFTADIQVRDADLKDLQALAGGDYPVTGAVTADLRVSGSQQDMHGSGNLLLLGGTIYGEPYRSLRSDLQVAGQEVQLRNLVLAHDGAQVTGSAAYNPSARSFRFDLHGAGFDLAEVRQLQKARLSVQGTADFAAQGSGTLDAPVINGNLTLRELVVNGEAAGDVEATAVTHGADMHLTARSRPPGTGLALDGDIHLRDDYPAQLHLRLAGLDVDPVLLAYIPGHITGHSQLTGAADLSGPLARPEQLRVDATIEKFSAEVEKLHIASDGPVHLTMADEVLHVDRVHLVGDQTDLTAGGTVGLSGAHVLGVHAAGHLNLQLVQTFNPDLLGHGATTLELAVSGTVRKPELQGRLEIKDAGLSIVDLPNGLSEINGSLVFNEDRLQVEKLTAKSGGGQLVLGGFISYANGMYFNLTATSGDIRLRYPPGVSAVANASLRFVGTTANSLLSGDVTVTRFGLNPRFDFALYLARSKQPPAMPVPGSPLNNLRFDVHIVSTPELQMETSMAKVSGNVDMRLRGSAAQPVLLGRVNVIQGDIFFNGTKYHLDRGDVTLTNPLRIEPILNMEISARVRDYDITIGLHGTLDRLSATYRSDPPLPTGDIVALIALGRTQEDAVLQPTTRPTYSDASSEAILGAALNASVSNRTQKLFGISKVKIDPQAGGVESNPNARVTIEQQVSDKVTLTYITNLTQSAQQIIQAEYNVNRNVSLVAVRDQNGVLGFVIKLRQRKR